MRYDFFTDCCCDGSGGGTFCKIISPLLHKLATLPKKIGAAIGCFYLIRNFVGQRLVDNLLGKIGLLCCPICEAAPKPADCYIHYIHIP